MRSVVMQRGREIGRHVGGHGVTEGVGCRDEHEGDDELAPVGLDQTAHALVEFLLALLCSGLLCLAVCRSVLDTHSEVDGHAAQGQGHQEWNTPSESLHRDIRDGQLQDRDECGADGEAHVGAEIEQGGVEATFPVRCVFRDERRRAGILPTGGESLNQFEEDEQGGSPIPDLGVSGQHTDEEGRRGHHDEGERQHTLPPQPVTKLPQDDAAQGTSDERHREHTQREQVLHGLSCFRQEDVTDEHGKITVDANVVPLHEVADHRTGDCFTKHLLIDDVDVLHPQFAAMVPMWMRESVMFVLVLGRGRIGVVDRHNAFRPE